MGSWVGRSGLKGRGVWGWSRGGWAGVAGSGGGQVWPHTEEGGLGGGWMSERGEGGLGVGGQCLGPQRGWVGGSGPTCGKGVWGWVGSVWAHKGDSGEST